MTAASKNRPVAAWKIANSDGTLEAPTSPLLDSGQNIGFWVRVLQTWACGTQSWSLTVKQHPKALSRCSQSEYSTFVVRPGDCLSEISRTVGTPMDILQRVNNIANIESLKAGQTLLIPRKRLGTKKGTIWDRRKKAEKRVIANWGDSLWSLAEDHNVTVDDIRRCNGLPKGSSHLFLGQELIIPAPRKRPTPLAYRIPPLPYLLRPENLQTVPVLRELCKNRAVLALLPKWRPEPFGLPVEGGWLSSLYGWKDGRWYFHDGIDIAVERGTAICAASSGKVTWSGWRGRYGKTVCVDHGNGYATLYAHCDDLHVRPGQFVRKGQVIALSGNTGHSTGPHLHFEIHKDGRTVDPLDLLPPL